MELFGQRCDLIKNIFRKIALGYMSVFQKPSQAPQKQEADRVYRDVEGRNTEERPRKKKQSRSAEERKGNRGEKGGETWRG